MPAPALSLLSSRRRRLTSEPATKHAPDGGRPDERFYANAIRRLRLDRRDRIGDASIVPTA